MAQMPAKAVHTTKMLAHVAQTLGHFGFFDRDHRQVDLDGRADGVADRVDRRPDPAQVVDTT
jgi:hypothetical protein